MITDESSGRLWCQIDLIKRSRKLSRRGQILDMAESGRSPEAIAAELSVYPDTVYNILRDQKAQESIGNSLIDPHPDLPDEWADSPLVYFVYALGAGAIKIGFTESGLASRLRQLETGCPFELIPAAVILGRKESTAHRALWRHRIKGEWYDASDEVWKYAESNGVFVYHHWLEPWVDVFEDGRDVVQVCPDVPAHTVAVWRAIRKAFDKSNLCKREREVICMRFGLSESCEELTLEQASARLKVTRERVRQIEKAALKKLARNRTLLDFARTDERTLSCLQ